MHLNLFIWFNWLQALLKRATGFGIVFFVISILMLFMIFQVLLLDPRNSLRKRPPPGKGDRMLHWSVQDHKCSRCSCHRLLSLASLPSHLLLWICQDAPLPMETSSGRRNVEEHHRNQQWPRNHRSQLHQVSTKIRPISFLLWILRVPEPPDVRPLHVRHRCAPPQQVLWIRPRSFQIHLGRKDLQPWQWKIYHSWSNVRTLPHWGKHDQTNICFAILKHFIIFSGLLLHQHWCHHWSYWQDQLPLHS